MRTNIANVAANRELSPDARAQSLEILRATNPSDFDGHTEFEQMDATQRLRWLEEAVDFASRYRGRAAGGSPIDGEKR